VPVFCRSGDGGRTWSPAEVVPAPIDCGWEVSNPIVELRDGRWLAPAATLAHKDRLGERVVLFVSPDRGRTWPEMITVFRDPSGRRGFFEQKVIELEPGRLLATSWTVELGSYADLENHYALSADGGRTWTDALATGMRGQTLTPLGLGGDRVLVLYNRRYGRQGIQGAIIRVSPRGWTVEHEETVWDARAFGEARRSRGTDEFESFAFGLPAAVRVDPETVLALYWCRPGERCMVRWTRLRLTLA
jgi:hypothetical protein